MCDGFDEEGFAGAGGAVEEDTFGWGAEIGVEVGAEEGEDGGFLEGAFGNGETGDVGPGGIECGRVDIHFSFYGGDEGVSGLVI